ncbi:MAG TPA: hypothetical protein VHS53_08330 [Mucilaginibacter sp.]|jgi:hypothetical protein|nr:hypothetical protein [Mucilaginibacter sp.]
MNLQAEKLEVVRMILDTDDKSVLREVKSLFKARNKTDKKRTELDKFYDGFKESVHEVKLSLDGKTELKDAKTWLNELHD